MCTLSVWMQPEVYFYVSFPEFYMRNSSDYVLDSKKFQNVCDLHKVPV